MSKREIHMLNDFFIKHPVFTLDEFKTFHVAEENRCSRKAEAALAYYCKSGKLQRLRRSLYAVITTSVNSAEKFVPDSFLITSRMSKDAVLVHHTALEFHGRAYSVFNRFTYQTAFSNKPFAFHNDHFKAISVPAPLRKVEQANFGVISTEHRGLEVKVASLERTMVDVFNRPVYSGSWEEIWRSLESVEFFDLDLVLEYVKLLNNSTTAACVGFFLEQNKDRLLVDDKYFNALRKLRPKQPHYFDRRKKNGKLLKEWNLLVSEEIFNKSWDEIL